jgi:hypothetical protein
MLRTVLSVSFALAISAPALASTTQAAVGDWGGALHHGDAAWRVRLHVTAVRGGGLIGTASGFPQELKTAPADVSLTGDRLTFSTATGEFDGVWRQDRAAWVGTWTQADMSEPLALRWDADDTGRRLRSTPPPVLTLPNGLPTSVPGEPANIIAPSR